MRPTKFALQTATMSAIPLMQRQMKQKAERENSDGQFLTGMSLPGSAHSEKATGLQSIRGSTSSQFWNGVHKHHQSVYVVNKGIMAHITEITQDARSHAKMEQNERLRKAADRLILPNHPLLLIFNHSFKFIL